ncbi:aminotransferase class V-fold PLP-dependent enzyme [Exilibacterium tricleocarpae]|uniref:Aminotransferase class V-fold PLP-dependent enzyme n=1 Tax=Exilibacterium tricleocarpae TaxID=2591008 RepID=A0A545SS00_9GAMM|nr:aminotransferase class V-fold PLP-dependent enzyme [Exilibacterium tricleocarpae]TQV67748.1 aminotransferase class V-fold PLP-dependent enzyme [Exilibacterium tricleocarpae]
MSQPDFDFFRSGFPALKEKVYLSICDKMILHDAVRENIDVFLDKLAMASANRVDHEEKVCSARARFARLMGVDAATVAAVKNVSDGINSVAWAVPMAEGDNVVVTAEAEHPNNVYPWLRVGKRGVEVRIVPAKPTGEIDVTAMIAAIDKRTRIVSCASVTFAPGHRTDIARLGEACRKRDVFLLVDGVQSAGILAHELVDENIDGFATSTSKGLLGLYGFGFLYVSSRWIERLEPAYLSRPAVSMDTEDHSSMGGFDYVLQPDSRRFELGSYNLAGAYAADKSLELLLGLGKKVIEKRVLELAALLHDGLSSLDLSPAVPRQGARQSHIITVGALDAGGHGFSTDPHITQISARLAEDDVIHTVRRGQLRFAVHAYNNVSDIEQVLSCVKTAIA